MFVFAAGSAADLDKCAWGESYWCSDLRAAKTCGAIKHCTNTIWKNQKLAEVSSMIWSFESMLCFEWFLNRWTGAAIQICVGRVTWIHSSFSYHSCYVSSVQNHCKLLKSSCLTEIVKWCLVCGTIYHITWGLVWFLYCDCHVCLCWVPTSMCIVY